MPLNIITWTFAVAKSSCMTAIKIVVKTTMVVRLTLRAVSKNYGLKKAVAEVIRL